MDLTMDWIMDLILDCKLINHASSPLWYDNLCGDIDTIQECTTTCHLILNPWKCNFLITSRRRHPRLPPTGLFLCSDVLEQVDIYHSLDILVTSNLSWQVDHVNLICSTSSKRVWVTVQAVLQLDWHTNILLCFYLCASTPGMLLSIMGPQYSHRHSILGISAS